METIKLRHAISIGILFSIGSITITMGYNHEYLIQSLLIAFIFSMSLIIFYQYLLNKYPNMNLYNIIKLKYNNVIGNILVIIFLILLVFNSVNIIYSFIDFITSINQLDFLSKNMIMLINFILLAYILKNSIINISRFTQAIFIITLFMIILLMVLGISEMNFENLLPIISFDKNAIFNQLNTLIVQPFLEITILFNVFSKVESKKAKKHIFIIVSSLSLIFLFLISIQTITILGKDYTGALNYPYYVAISCINLSKIVLRIEALSLIIFYFSAFVKLLFTINSLTLGFNTLVQNRKKYNYTFLLFVHILSLIMFDNIAELKLFMNYYSIFFIFYSIVLLFLLFIKKEKNIVKHNT